MDADIGADENGSRWCGGGRQVRRGCPPPGGAGTGMAPAARGGSGGRALPGHKISEKAKHVF
uniref:Uncharacterized protein n=1 Tax=Oryza glumipatula TaxID=40148 RepID=A0A0D9ZDB6_9ORYZ